MPVAEVISKAIRNPFFIAGVVLQIIAVVLASLLVNVAPWLAMIIVPILTGLATVLYVKTAQTLRVTHVDKGKYWKVTT